MPSTLLSQTRSNFLVHHGLEIKMDSVAKHKVDLVQESSPIGRREERAPCESAAKMRL